MKIIITVCVILAVFILIAAGSIEKNPQWKGIIEEENGVKVIKNPKEPLYGEIEFELEEDLVIGDEDDENYMFYRGVSIEVDSEENIFVLDKGNFRIQKFDRNGKYLLSIGKEGQGPGEFERPSTLYLDSENNIYVWDMRRRKIHKFAKDGNFISSISPERSTSEFGITRDGNYIAQTLSRGERKSDKPGDHDSFFNIDLISQEGTTIKTVATFRWERSDMIKTERGFLGPSNLCTPRLCLCPINEDFALYGYSSDYSLFRINSKGETVYIVKKDEPPQPVTKAEKDKVIDSFLEGQRERKLKISRSKYARALRFPEHKPFYERIIKDDNYRIYVEKFKFFFDRSDVADFDIFSKDGYYLYKAKIPVQNPLIRHGYVYKTEYDQDTGYAKIKRYKIKNWEQIKNGI